MNESHAADRDVWQNAALPPMPGPIAGCDAVPAGMVRRNLNKDRVFNRVRAFPIMTPSRFEYGPTAHRWR
jgi:hypothetical protein